MDNPQQAEVKTGRTAIAKGAEKEALQAYFRYVGGDSRRLEFALPRGAYLALALAALVSGPLILLYPDSFASRPDFMGLLAGWGSIAVGLVLGIGFLRRSGRLLLDGGAREVRLDYAIPGSRFHWQRPFSGFDRIETSQVRDMHGLHNHWRIELVATDGTRLKLGYGFIGAVRRASRDRLLQQLVTLTELPVVEA